MIARQIRPAIVATVALMIITGLIYPGIVTGLAQVIFPEQSAGSLLTVNGQVVGSSLIGQKFEQPWYFHGRPSAAGDGYDATASGGTNKGPTDRKLADTLIAGAIAQAEKDGAVKHSIPADMVTASASGLDPHISPANAGIQIARVARERGVSEEAIREFVLKNTERRQFGFLGEPRVNVLKLNLAIDTAVPHAARALIDSTQNSSR